MSKHVYELAMTASNESEAEVKIKALTVLAAYLSAKELEKLAYTVKDDPETMALAKHYLGL